VKLGIESHENLSSDDGIAFANQDLGYPACIGGLHDLDARAGREFARCDRDDVEAAKDEPRASEGEKPADPVQQTPRCR